MVDSFQIKQRQALSGIASFEVEPFVKSAGKLLGDNVSPFTGMALEKMNLQELTSIMEYSVDADAAKRALCFAHGIADDGLTVHVQFALDLCELLRALARAEHLGRACGINDPKRVSSRKVNEDQIKLLQTIRTRVVGFEQLANNNSIHFKATKPFSHVQLLDNMLDAPTCVTSTSAESNRIQSWFGCSWASDLSAITTAIRDMCPEWEPYEENLLKRKDIVDQLVDNPYYTKIGPLANEGQRQIKLIKQMHRDNKGSLVDVGLAKSASEAVEFGKKTVAYTFVCFHTTREWIKIQNKAVAKNSVVDLRAALKPSKVTLTSQMEKVLEMWANGEMIDRKSDGRPLLPDEDTVDKDSANIMDRDTVLDEVTEVRIKLEPVQNEPVATPPVKKRKLRDMLSSKAS